MKNIKVFHSVALGESHKAKNTPCQDAAFSYEDAEKGIYIALVSDGHGSERHFMSDHGSKILVKVAFESISSFIEAVDCSQLEVPFATSGAISSNDDNLFIEEKNSAKKQEEQSILMKGLISSVISRWNSSIEKHWNENTPSLEYMKEKNVPEATIKDYSDGKKIELAYGCTSIAFAKTSDFWFAFQIGDGTCIAFDNSANPYYPIPNDNRFSGNTTASMCNEDAIDSFRYCYGNTEEPVAVFLGSDGLDGVFGTMDEFSLPKLENFYSNIIKQFVKNGFDATAIEIADSLPILSAKGVTRDDMSLAGVVKMDEIATLVPLILKKKIVNLRKEFEVAEADYAKKDEEASKVESEIKRKREEMLPIEDDIKEQEQTIDQLKSVLLKTKEDLEKNEVESQQLDKNLKQIHSGIDKAVNEKETIRKKLNAFVEELSKLNLVSNINTNITDADELNEAKGIRVNDESERDDFSQKDI